MSERAAEISAFLTAAGWATAHRTPLAGDASARRYERLTRGEDRAVLMDAPPAGDTPRFVQIAQWLLNEGFSAPAILAQAPERGLLLLEDLGDDLLSRLILADPGREATLYAEVTGFLLDLHRRPAPAFLAPLDGPALGALLTLTADHYPTLSREAALALPELISRSYARLNQETPVLCLRDFHAENALWLPERVGAARLGLLDFQDAVAGHPAYDLVSALQDARRDVAPAIEARETRRYAEAAGLEAERFGALYALLGAQRGLRILGVFARLATSLEKPLYLALMPRVHRYIERNLAHPALADIARTVAAAYPAPTAELLEQIQRP